MKNILLGLTLFVFACANGQTKLQTIKNTNNPQTKTQKDFKPVSKGIASGQTNVKIGKSLSPSQQFVLNSKLVGSEGNDPRNLPLSKNGKLLSVDGFEVDFVHSSNPEISSVCYTPSPKVNGQNKDASCSYSVPCDNASNRDGASTALKYFQLEWHVMWNGGAPSNIDQARIDALMAELNADYSTHNMIFCANPANFIEDAGNYVHDEDTEEFSLKDTYNVTPTQVINIYVVGSMGPGGYARFPYDPNGGTDAHGGIVLNRGNCNVGTHTLAHEMGHVFGLEHTFSGVDERGTCSSCYEKVRNVNGSSNSTGVPTPNGGPYTSEGDREGDWCSDTNPHDTYAYNCGTSSNTNGACDSDPWANAPVNNHMSYSFCSSQFTDQQARRMHCMVGTYLSSWTSYAGGVCGTLPPVADFVGTPLYGVAPLTVTFTDASSPTSIITGWSWNFDNLAVGGVAPATAATQGSHVVTYTNPGVYEVTLTVTSPNGNDTETKTAYVEVISPPNTCDTLDTQWNTPAPTLTSYTFATNPPAAPYNQGGNFAGVPSPTLLTNPTDAVSFSERFPSAGAGTTVGGVYVIIGDLIDADGDLQFNINVWDDNAGEPDWLGPATAAGYLGGSGVFTPANFLPQDGFLYQFWIPFTTPVSIPSAFFHIDVTMVAGDPADQFLLGTSANGQGEGDNSNFVWSTEVNPPGTNSYLNDIGIDFDLAIYPMLGPYTPTCVIENLSFNSVCDTTYVTITDTLLYTPSTDMASIEYQFSDGQVFSFSAPFSAERTVNTFFTAAGPVDLDIIAISQTCGRVDTNSTTLSFPFQVTPDADFTKDQTNPICNTQAINFTGSPVGMSDYTWDFGDGTVLSSGTSNLQSHTYATPGIYYVSLTATDESPYASDTLFLEQFEAAIPGTFTLVDGDGGTDNYGIGSWEGGTYDIDGNGEFEAVSSSWVAGPPAFVADDWLITPAIGPLPANQALYWEAFASDPGFPDGYEVRLSTTGALPATVGNFSTLLFSIPAESPTPTNRSADLSAYAGQTVYIAFRNNSNDMNILAIDDILVGTKGLGCSNTDQKLDFVEIIDCTIVPPTADGNADVTSGCSPLDVTFTDITSIGDPATSWLWNFDDGTFSTAQNPGVHTFTSAGTYNVSFEACNGGGCTTEIIVITVANGSIDVDDLADQTVCDSFTLPAITGTGLSGSESYYTATGGTGSAISAGTAITSTQTLYIYDINGLCWDEETVLITVNNTPVITNPGNQVACDSYTLPVIAGTNLTGGEAYFTGPAGTGTSYAAGTSITTSVTPMYIYDISGTCSDDESFNITINNTPVITNPGNQTACDSYTLPVIAGTNLTGGEAYFTGPGGTGTSYAAGASITSSVAPMYIYDASGTCSDDESFNITINNTPVITNPGNQAACDSYTLPVIAGTNLTGGEAYFTGPGGTGTSYAAGASITSSVTPLYIYDASGTCSDDESFNITITVSPVITNPGNQAVCNNYTLPAIAGSNLTGGQAYYTGPGGTGTSYAAGASITSSVTPMYIYDANGICSDDESFNITITTAPVITNPGNQAACDSYTLPVIAGTNLTGGQAYYTGPGGTGTSYAAGASITTSVTPMYIYDVSGTCSDDESFNITITNSPVITNPGNQTACDSYTLPAILGTNLTGGQAYYTGPGGTGTSYAAGASITSSVTPMYIYNSNGTCSDDESFNITINNTPVITNPGNQTACDSYTLPVIAGTNLSGGEMYYTGAGGTGTSYAAGASITASVTPMYIYDASGTCSDDESFNITINNTPVITNPGNQTSCDSYTLPVIAGTNLSGGEMYYTGIGGTGTSYAAGASITASVTPMYIYDASGTCSDDESFNITITNTPVITNPGNQTSCDSYTLPVIAGTNLSGGEMYYTGPGGTGTSYAAGAAITTSVTPMYIYDANGTCSDDESFNITINASQSFTVSGTDPTTCNGTDGFVDISGLAVSTNYNVTYDDDAVTVGPTVMNSGVTGTITIGSLNAGTYDNIIVEINGCPTTDVAGVSLANPGAPDVDDIPNAAFCDTYTLPVITGTGLTGSEGYFTGSGGTGSALAVGSSITTTTTFYIYDVNGACADEEVVTITINNTPTITNPGAQTACDAFTLPVILGTNLSGGEMYYTGLAGTGTSYAAGASITSSVTPMYIYDASGTCSDEESFNIAITVSPVITNPGNQTACDSYTLPVIGGSGLTGGQAYYTGPGGTGTSYAAGASITSSVTPMYIYDANGTCSDEESFNITITSSPVITNPGNQTACDSYTLPVILGTNLSGGEMYYTGVGGTGTSYAAGASITSSVTPMYIYDASGTCSDDESFNITITSSPVITNPGNQTACDSYTLPAIGGSGLTGGQAYFTGPGGTGTSYAAGASITTSVTPMYIYDANGTCSDDESFNITINNSPVITNPGPQVACGSYTLPIILGTNLSGGEMYYTGPGGTGTSYAAGASITASVTPMYIYDASGSCTDEESFILTVTPGPAITNPGDQTACDSYVLPAILGANLTGGQSYYTGPGGTGTSYAAGASITSSITPMYIYDANGTCTNEQTFNITITSSPVITNPGNQTACDSYTLPVILGSNLTGGEMYYTGAGGTGTSYAAGASITASVTPMYIYDANGTCNDEESFNITITNTPVITNPGNQTACDSYTLPVILGTNLSGSEMYYTGVGGTGTSYAAGASITASVTPLYIYDASGTCSDEESFNIAITTSPVITNPGNQTICVSYTLPVIAGTNLTGGEMYYTGVGGTGTSYAAGASITASVTPMYIYDANGTCADEESFNINITASPVITNPGNQVVCDSYTLPVILGTDLSGGEMYYTGAGGTGTSYAAGATITSSATPLYIYDVSGTCSDEEMFNITVNSSPTFSVVGNDPTTCNGTDGSIVISGLSNGANYNVSYDDDAVTVGPSVITSNGSGEITISTLNGGVYNNIIVEINGCSTTDATGVTLTNPGAPDVDDLADVTVCDSYTLPVITGTNLTGNESYFTAVGGAGTSLAAGSVINATSTLFIYDINGSCSDEETVTITVNATPVLDAVTDETVCGSFTLPVITGTNLSGTESYFDGPGGTGTSYAAGASITNSTTPMYIYAANGSCTDETSFNINIDQNPDVAFADVDQLTCDSILTVQLNGNNPSVGIGTWSVVNGSGTFTNTNDPTTEVTGYSVGINEYMWSISNGVCPASEDNVIIEVEECVTELVIPSGFTPDGGDNVNAVWEIEGIQSYPDCEVTIFNKWGSEIFTSIGYADAWDGTYNNNPLPVGSYFYIITLNDGTEPYKGTVTIIK